eukprot:592676-Amphidinium_carterae.1
MASKSLGVGRKRWKQDYKWWSWSPGSRRSQGDPNMCGFPNRCGIQVTGGPSTSVEPGRASTTLAGDENRDCIS